MNLDQFIAAMLAQHRRVLRPTDPPPPHGGWYVIATESEYVDGGFSLRVTDSNHIITGAVKHALAQLGFDVQHAPAMTAWRRGRVNVAGPSEVGRPVFRNDKRPMAAIQQGAFLGTRDKEDRCQKRS